MTHHESVTRNISKSMLRQAMLLMPEIATFRRSLHGSAIFKNAEGETVGTFHRAMNHNENSLIVVW